MLNLVGRILLLFCALAMVPMVIAFVQLLTGGSWAPWVVLTLAMIATFWLLLRYGARNLQFVYVDIVVVKSSPLFVARLVGYNAYTIEMDNSGQPLYLFTKFSLQMDVTQRLRTVRMAEILYLHVKESHE